MILIWQFCDETYVLVFKGSWCSRLLFGFQKDEEKTAKILKNDYLEMNDYHTEATDENIARR